MSQAERPGNGNDDSLARTLLRILDDGDPTTSEKDARSMIAAAVAHLSGIYGEEKVIDLLIGQAQLVHDMTWLFRWAPGEQHTAH